MCCPLRLAQRAVSLCALLYSALLVLAALCVVVVSCCHVQFIYFVDEFQLVSRDEQAPLRDLIDNIYRKDAQGGAGGSSGGGGGGGRPVVGGIVGAGGAGAAASHEDTLTKEQDVLAKVSDKRQPRVDRCCFSHAPNWPHTKPP